MAHLSSPLILTPSAGSQPFLIGIAGASGSGKSCLAERVAMALEAPVLSLDSYYRDLAHLPIEQRARQNFDHPDSLDWPLLLEHLQALRAGQPIDVPHYDFSTHTRQASTCTLCAAGSLILEGILALHHPQVRSLLSLKVFVDLGTEECLRRRMERDIRERGRTPECVLRQYQETVLPMYNAFVAPTAALADLRVRGDANLGASVGQVLDAIPIRP